MRISKTTIVLAGIAAFTILAVWTIITGKRAPAPDEGSVTVAVTPQELIPGKPAIFQIVFDTHSVDLNFDVAQIAELRSEKGNTYGAPVWSGDPPGGHHRKGTLTFPTPLAATNITLTLNTIAGIPERTFEWKVR